MKNRVEEIIAAKDKSVREKKEKALEKALVKNPLEKEKLIKEFKQAVAARGKRIEYIKEQVELKLKLQEASEIISLAYISKNYFNKTRQWLYQRINGNIIDGKKRAFTDEQIKTLNFALKDISKKIGSLSV